MLKAEAALKQLPDSTEPRQEKLRLELEKTQATLQSMAAEVANLNSALEDERTKNETQSKAKGEIEAALEEQRVQYEKAVAEKDGKMHGLHAEVANLNSALEDERTKNETQSHSKGEIEAALEVQRVQFEKAVAENDGKMHGLHAEVANLNSALEDERTKNETQSHSKGEIEAALEVQRVQYEKTVAEKDGKMHGLHAEVANLNSALKDERTKNETQSKAKGEIEAALEEQKVQYEKSVAEKDGKMHGLHEDFTRLTFKLEVTGFIAIFTHIFRLTVLFKALASLLPAVLMANIVITLNLLNLERGQGVQTDEKRIARPKENE